MSASHSLRKGRQLSDETREQLRLFVRCAGNLQEAGKALGVSDETLRSALTAGALFREDTATRLEAALAKARTT